MRKALALILCSSAPSWATPVQVAHVHCSGSTTCTTAATNMTGATLIVLCQTSAGAADTTVSDSAGNTWTALTAIQSGGANPWVQLFYKANPTVSATQTFSTGTGGGDYGLTAHGYSGIITASPFDQQNGAGAAGITTKQPGSITPTLDGELLVSCLGGTISDTNSTIDNSFTLSDTFAYDGSTTYGGGVAYKVQTTAAAINPTWTFSSANASAVIASFKASATTATSAFGFINNPVPGGL